MSYQQVDKGSTDVSVTLTFLDADGQPVDVDHATAGLALWYRRDGAAKMAITPAALSALTDAHTDGGVEPIDDGETRVDAPDAAFATGVSKVVVGGTATSLVCIPAYVDLTDPAATTIRSAVGLASANLDTQLDALPTAAETAAAVAAQTDIAAGLAGITAIEADTQDIQGRLPAALTGDGLMKSDTLRQNGGQVFGDGTSGNKWRGGA